MGGLQLSESTLTRSEMGEGQLKTMRKLEAGKVFIINLLLLLDILPYISTLKQNHLLTRIFVN